MDNKLIQETCTDIRKDIVKMVTESASGHPGGSLSAVEILATLYFHEMNVDSKNPNNIDRDRFVLSKGHAAPVLYSTLAHKGFFPKENLLTLRKLKSMLQGHPNMEYVPGIDMSTGSLGQGISTAVGMALAGKIDKKDYRVYCVLGDGELEEGQVWEATMAAAHYKLNNLLAIVDFNGLQIDGDITTVMNPTPIDKKFEAFGWNVLMADGHNIDELINCYATAKTVTDKPTVIVAKTVKGKGVPFMENLASWHGTAPTKEQCAEAIKCLGGNN